MRFRLLLVTYIAGLVAYAGSGISGAHGQVAGVWIGEETQETAYAVIGSENETANLVLRCQGGAYDIFIQMLREPRGVSLRDEIPVLIRLNREQQVRTSAVMTAKAMFAVRFEKTDKRFGLSLVDTKRIDVAFGAGDSTYALSFQLR